MARTTPLVSFVGDFLPKGFRFDPMESAVLGTPLPERFFGVGGNTGRSVSLPRRHPSPMVSRSRDRFFSRVCAFFVSKAEEWTARKR